jgi:hypothetical protein
MPVRHVLIFENSFVVLDWSCQDRLPQPPHIGTFSTIDPPYHGQSSHHLGIPLLSMNQRRNQRLLCPRMGNGWKLKEAAVGIANTDSRKQWQVQNIRVEGTVYNYDETCHKSLTKCYD